MRRKQYCIAVGRTSIRVVVVIDLRTSLGGLEVLVLDFGKDNHDGGLEVGGAKFGSYWS